MAAVEPKGRTFSKRLVVVNSALAWAVLAVALFTNQAAAVSAYAFGFLAAIGGAYMGVGHMDLRMFLSSLSGAYGAATATSDGAAMPEPQEPGQ
jgi:hypothetical protein